MCLGFVWTVSPELLKSSGTRLGTVIYYYEKEYQAEKNAGLLSSG